MHIKPCAVSHDSQCGGVLVGALKAACHPQLSKSALAEWCHGKLGAPLGLIECQSSHRDARVSLATTIAAGLNQLW